MRNYISKIQVNLFDGLFQEEILFEKGLNIIAGENGTGKTRLLGLLKSQGLLAQSVNGNSQASQIKVLAFSPKRNSERKTVESAFQEVIQQNKKFETYISNYLSKNLQDNTFESYSSFGELFAIYFELNDRKGKRTRRSVMTKIVKEFNPIIKKVFNDYQISASWDENVGVPIVKIIKNSVDLSLGDLSCGEQEILSLIFNLYVSRQGCDVFLIDEPEIHLNWNLELMLFKFLDFFCKKYKKQIIVTTHSRVVFNQDFYPVTQFLVWERGKITCKSDVDEESKNKLAGEAVSIIKQVKLIKKTFFVEDSFHERVLEVLASRHNQHISAVSCGNKANVVSLYQRLKNDPDFSNVCFMVDSDNEGNPFKEDDRFIFLDRYCLECYFVKPSALAKVFNKSTDDIRKEMISIIKSRKKEILGKHKHLEFLIDRLGMEDIKEQFLNRFDCSYMLQDLIEKFNPRTKKKSFISKYFDNVDENKGFIGKLTKKIKK